MSRHLEKSIVLISSASSVDREAKVIGTGFAFYRTQYHTYFLTCAHVVKDVGGEENVLVNNTPAEVVAIGNKSGFDLAVLRAVLPSDIRLLKLRILERAKGSKIKILGYYFYGELKRHSAEEIEGEVGERTFLTQSIEGSVEQVTTWKLRITKGLLQKGYSGAPIVDSKQNCVLGVATDMEGNGERGRAISVEALKEIWPDLPPELLDIPKFPKYYFTICICSAVFTFVLGLLSGIAMPNLVSKKYPINIHLINKDMRIKKVDIKSDNSDKVICNYDTPNGDRAVINDCSLVSKPMNVTIEVSKVNNNRPPQGKPDRFETNKNNTRIIKKSELIENDEDPDGNKFKIHQVSPKSVLRVAVIDDNDTIKYTPLNNFVGVDTFDYTLKDSFDEYSNPIEVKVIVKNTKPTGSPINIRFNNKNKQINIDFSNHINDKDRGDKENLTVVVENEETQNDGTVSINPNNNQNLIYTPPQDFTAKDTFYYKVVDRYIDSSGVEFKEESAPIKVTIDFDLELLSEYWKGKGYSWAIERYYTQIFTDLKEERWSAADKITYELMYHIMEMSNDYDDVKNNYLKPNHIRNFPCEHLYIIDQLWKNTSGERSLSFSYQKQKFQELEKITQKDDAKFIREWAKVLGWFNGTIWTNRDEWNDYQKEKPKGYYPMGGMFIGSYNYREESLDEQKVDAHRQSLINCSKIKP
ncbi:Ig-like domain-containing protein [Dapis sp. BLCC M229]|uniref:Ig-like domain-containing protein n=1 Tax=Dapis sp. BLCC M229 TaxID=3400188 RepID=UPI003CF0C34C